MLGSFNNSSKLRTFVCFHNYLGIQVVVHSRNSQGIDRIIRLIIQVEPIRVRVLSDQEVLIVQSGFNISQEHINGSLVLGFNEVLLGHMLNRGVGLCIALNRKDPMRHVAPNAMGDPEPESKLSRQLALIKLTVWPEPDQVVEFKVATLTNIRRGACNFLKHGSSIRSTGASTH